MNANEDSVGETIACFKSATDIDAFGQHRIGRKWGRMGRTAFPRRRGSPRLAISRVSERRCYVVVSNEFGGGATRCGQL